MPKRIRLGVGTTKGLFIFESDAGRRDWRMLDPLLPEWEVSALLLDRQNPDLLRTGTVHYAWGATVRTTEDGGRDWKQVALRDPAPEGQTDADAGRYPIKRIWQLTRSPDGGRLYAGVDEAALYASDDDGASWREVEGLTKHPSRPHWQPGNGGLCLHTILIDPANPKRMWVGISAVGVFGTDDGGETWKPLNRGLPPMTMTGSPDEDAMFCIHKMALDPTASGRLYMQFHAHDMTPDKKMSPGIFRSDDGGQNWQAIDQALPHHFGFPLAVTPRGEVFAIPLDADANRIFPGGRAGLWRTRDGGENWQQLTRGFASEPVFSGVLRDAMTTDSLEQAGIYFGTTNGDVWASPDAGENWQKLPGRLPRVLVVRAEAYEA